MSKQQLYINDVAVDMPTDEIKFRVSSNILADISKVMTAHSYSITLPRTMTNDKVFVNAYVAGADTGGTSTHCYLKASFYLDGIPLFEGGKAVLNQVDDKGYNLNLYWGLIDVFDEIKSEGLQLCELPMSTHWNEQTMATWDNLTKFYLGDNPPIYNGNMNTTIYNNLDSDSKALADTKPWTMPFVNAGTVMSKIATVYGLTFDYSTDFYSRMIELVHPLTTLNTKCKDETLTFEVGAKWEYGTDGKKYLSCSIPRNANNGRFLQNAIESVANNIGLIDIYSKTKINVKSIKITAGQCDIKWYAIVHYAKRSEQNVISTYNSQSGYWEITHEWRDVVCETGYPILSITTDVPWASSETPDFTIKFDVAVDDIGECSIGQNYCYERNYPSIKVYDYIGELLAHCGACIVGSVTKPNAIRIVTIDEIFNAALKSYDTFGVSSITMSIDDLAQRNKYTHKENDDNSDDGLEDYDASGVVMTSDVTLELEREAYKSNFKVPRQDLIKLWKVEKQDNSTSYKASWNNAGDYIAHYDSGELSNTGQDFQSIIDAYYTHYAQVVQRPKAVELVVRLTALNLIAFSFENPIYIPQLGRSYIATSLESDKGEFYKLKLIQI